MRTFLYGYGNQCWISRLPDYEVSLYDKTVHFSSLPVQRGLCNVDTSGTANGPDYRGVLMSRVVPICLSYVYENLGP